MILIEIIVKNALNYPFDTREYNVFGRLDTAQQDLSCIQLRTLDKYVTFTNLELNTWKSSSVTETDVVFNEIEIPKGVYCFSVGIFDDEIYQIIILEVSPFPSQFMISFVDCKFQNNRVSGFGGAIRYNIIINK